MICECCGKQHDGKFGSGRFCCRSCANTRNYNAQSKQNISTGLKKYYKQFKTVKTKKYFCGSEKLNKQYKEISKHQSCKWFNNLIPFGLNIDKLYTQDFIYEYYKVKELLYYEYIINKLSPKDIYNKYQCSNYINHSETLLHIFKSFNFPIRNYSEAAVNAYLQGKNANNVQIQYKTEYHNTWNNKKYFLRSSYEIIYANELDNNKQIIQQNLIE